MASVPKTQKAKSVHVLAQQGYLLAEQTNLNVSQWALFNPESPTESVEDARNLAGYSRSLLQTMTGLSDGPIGPSLPPDILGCTFVRPCPKRPRHGFVDSRPLVLPKEDS